jgi:hypothetical protein
MAFCTLSALAFASGAPRAMARALDVDARHRETVGRSGTPAD